MSTSSLFTRISILFSFKNLLESIWKKQSWKCLTVHINAFVSPCKICYHSSCFSYFFADDHEQKISGVFKFHFLSCRVRNVHVRQLVVDSSVDFPLISSKSRLLGFQVDGLKGNLDPPLSAQYFMIFASLQVI